MTAGTTTWRTPAGDQSVSGQKKVTLDLIFWIKKSNSQKKSLQHKYGVV